MYTIDEEYNMKLTTKQRNILVKGVENGMFIIFVARNHKGEVAKDAVSSRELTWKLGQVENALKKRGKHGRSKQKTG